LSVVGGAPATNNASPARPSVPPPAVVQVPTKPASAVSSAPAPAAQGPVAPSAAGGARVSGAASADRTPAAAAPAEGKNVGPLLFTSDDDAKGRTQNAPIKVQAGSVFVRADPQAAADGVRNRTNQLQ